jgi:hypothetical protein
MLSARVRLLCVFVFSAHSAFAQTQFHLFGISPSNNLVEVQFEKLKALILAGFEYLLFKIPFKYYMYEKSE